MLAVILNMVDVDFVGGMHRQLTRNSDQGEVIGNQEAAKIKQHVVVRAQANQVVRRCRARRVGNPKVGYARPLHKGLQRTPIESRTPGSSNYGDA